jgi:hypothetical protein
MSARRFFLRLAAGFVILLVVLVIGFATVLQFIPIWGATPEELTQTLPGDDILPNPPSAWVNAVTINAPPEQVWPWIIQIGDTRGGFYSYMFIERGFMRAIGDPALNPNDFYINAKRVHPEWQNPPSGQGIILDYVAISDYQPNSYVLAQATEKFAGMGWTWLWHITPTADGQTRLVVHLRLQPPVDPNAADNPVMGWVMDLGGFVMEKNMIDGIKLRAEGRTEPGWIESAEIVLWLAALLAGLAAGWLYLTRSGWQRPLLVALTAVIALFVLTYLQPEIWLRALIDAALVGGVVWAANK